MKTNKTTVKIWALVALLLCGMASSASASNVEARLSMREAFVGMPVVLQIAINNAEDYQQPAIPEIDGCDILSAGVPLQSSQITIINGRRSASRSVTIQYLITPRRIGTFEIPSITIKVDGQDVQTEPQSFVASKSNNGDLIFVEIDGGSDKVFVGQPLDMTLKIWIKPYRDPAKNITLSEDDMWQMISEQTSWGGFADRLKDLTENRQRPGGREVLRDDGQGNQRSYYLYEIEATVYPKRPGEIDADGVQIVASYPTALGKSRDPFESFFKDSPLGGRRPFGGRSPFGGNSPISQMMNDNFLSSPFSNRLSVSSTRPIVAEATVDATEVIAVPTLGRPDDYRGAVGRYKIATQANPTHVSAGDPITLNIGIAGTGPMELIQAPPLARLPSLSADFKVNDEPLAGFVQDDSKVFSTTIRPRHEGITQIPSIPFSFFDPDTETFETVMSEPIAITVDKSETLALDAIVGKARRSDSGQNDDSAVTSKLVPDFTNFESSSVLASQTASSTSKWWWLFAAFPPLIWLVVLFGCNRDAIARRLPSFKSADGQCRNAIENAKQRSHIIAALIQYVSKRTGKTCDNATSAVGALRTCGMHKIAADVESFFARCDRESFSGIAESTFEILQSARELVGQIESAFASSKKPQVKGKMNRRHHFSVDHMTDPCKLNGTAKRFPKLLIFLTIFALSTGTVMASDESSSVNFADASTITAIMLTPHQQKTILQEASQAYSKATALAETDSAEARELFTDAANKYQLLVDSGVSNSQLYFNLGNSYLQNDKLGQAIVNYERARTLDPGNKLLAVNLEFANSLVNGNEEASATESQGESVFSLARIRSANNFIVEAVGAQTIVWLLVISSLLFWGFLIVWAAGYRFPARRLVAVPLLVLVFALGSEILNQPVASDETNGVIVANNVTLHAGDGQQFDAVFELPASSQGHRVHVLTQRGDWLKIRTKSGDEGWVPDDNVCVNARFPDTSAWNPQKSKSRPAM